MGVTFSSDPSSNGVANSLSDITVHSDGYSNPSSLLSHKQRMRVDLEVSAKLVSAYISHVYSPLIDEVGLKSLVFSALRSKESRTGEYE